MTSTINLQATLACGQVFHWRERGGGSWEGLIGESLAVVGQGPSGELQVLAGREDSVRNYLAMDHDLEAVYRGFPSDSTMGAALEFCRGLRIIRQPEWECLATFITSSMKQVAHIRQMSFALRQQFGRKVAGTDWLAYPTAAALASATEDDLRGCGLGYRAKYLRGTAQRVAEGSADLAAWRKLPDSELRTALSTLPGVGRKVANCVMLFGYERLAAFPVDTWIARILQRTYWRGGKKPTPLQLEQNLAERFGPQAGYAQQYLFHHARSTEGRGSPT